MTIYDEIIKIKAKKLPYGTLGKMDAVLRLAKKGYQRDELMEALENVAQAIPNKLARSIAIETYCRRLK